MDKPTHKMVDGKRIELTEEECRAIMEEWEKNEKESQEKQEQWLVQQKKNLEIQQKISGMLGISVEELLEAFKT